jgi:hypothetical protein
MLLVPAALAAQNTAPAPQPVRTEQLRPVPPPPPSPPGVPAPAGTPGVRVMSPMTIETPGQLASRRAGQAVNVKVDVTFHDQTGNEPRRTKTVSVVTADGLTGYVRTISTYDGVVGPAPLNIDVEPRILTGGKVRVLLNLQYTVPALNVERRTQNEATLRSTDVRENLSLVLDDGKSLVVSQSADAVGDRRVTVEVVATIGK